MGDKVEPKRVVGLKYEVGQGLPQMILKGSGKLAEEILRQRNPFTGPPVVKDAQLLNELYKLPIDATIGPELFELVAVLLAHVFSIEGQIKAEDSWSTH